MVIAAAGAGVGLRGAKEAETAAQPDAACPGRANAGTPAYVLAGPNEIPQPPLKKRVRGGRLPQRLEVLPGEVPRDENERVDVAVGAVIIMHRGDKLDVALEPLLEGKEGIHSDVW